MSLALSAALSSNTAAEAEEAPCKNVHQLAGARRPYVGLSPSLPGFAERKLRQNSMQIGWKKSSNNPPSSSTRKFQNTVGWMEDNRGHKCCCYC